MGAPLRSAMRYEQPRDIGAGHVNTEGKTELALQLVLPLHRHGSRSGNDDVVNAPAQQKLARDEPGFDRLAETDVVSDQEVDPRQPQGLAQRQQLVGIEPDTGAERRL